MSEEEKKKPVESFAWVKLLKRLLCRHSEQICWQGDYRFKGKRLLIYTVVSCFKCGKVTLRKEAAPEEPEKTDLQLAQEAGEGDHGETKV